MKGNVFDISLWERKVEEKEREREADRLKTLEKTKKNLKNYFTDKGVGQVYLTGSLLEEGKFYSFSDIDIAVQGLSEWYFKVFTELEELLGRKIDLIELERCRFAELIKKNGLKIR
ncbi:MAG: nucleotidyltransferase family protein [bacterium]